MFCEARGDFEHAAALIDRVLREHGPAWVSDVMDASLEGIRTWHPDTQKSFFDVHGYKALRDRLRVQVPHGHFQSEPGGPGALMARTLFRIVRKLIAKGNEVDRVVLIWDMDGDAEARRKGLEQARREALSFASFRIVLGCPNLTREAWILAGFEPSDDAEEQQLAKLRQELGFHPAEKAHQLDSNDEQARRNPKRVVRELLGQDPERHRRCWEDTSLDLLHGRGGESGLAAYLDEVRASLLPLCTSPSTGTGPTKDPS